MAKYELLAIFPGTLSEDEVAVGVTKVKEVIEKNGATAVTHEDLGKSRLAYPMNHIRYGYFRMFYFEAETKLAPVIQEKLTMSNVALRAIVRKYNPKAEIKKIAQIMSDIAISSQREEMRKEGEPDTYEAIQTISREKKDEAPVVEKKTESIELQDIDKKLDELLESDLTKV